MAAVNTQKPKIIAISTSESPDMAVFGLSEGHLREAVAEFAIYLLSSGANLAYGGDLRPHGFTELLFELVMRYRRREDTDARVINYLAWPVHVSMTAEELDVLAAELEGFARLALIGQDGKQMSMEDRQALPSHEHEPDDHEWGTGLTAMRRTMREETDARIVLGGRVEGYKGDMPGIAEEALLSLQSSQPTFLIGGFGGCTRDIAETVGLVNTWAGSRSGWPGRQQFERYTQDDLHNGLSLEENQVLAHTPHIDQAVVLVRRGLHRLHNDGNHDGSGQEGH